MVQVAPDWIAVDWGTSRLRVWAMQGATAREQRQSEDGLTGLTPDAFEPALLRLAGDWIGPDGMDIVACGMVGARQGWHEVPYVAVPTAPPVAAAVRSPAIDTRVRLWIVPGMKQASPPDVMRGEETQIAGFLALNKGWDGVICLPGTHTKWVHVSAGEVVSFQTALTGELFALLARHSTLRHSIAETGWDEDAFAAALDQARSRPERLAAALFALRADDLLNGCPPDTARARLSGLLIGADLAASRAYWLGQQVAVIGASETAAPYVRALQLQGVPATVADGDRMTLAGLTAAHRAL
ncbi:2-dehydro-3-deoxygalactonokinase [Sedimentitalea arenosa]|uniref:2-dehydro-3-deoxygalactonokinase n=1 Tax=Sedimentitalea arenosa TaxID=2798803 RepID=A0A8J7LRV7_9RHOB|nr:2-dehydro-3-deoxygalactonokinase [Arenibacterium arenosum]MBJ6371304.1 2-dehydro-3-deoxygalactonokinase [Arenibacterium arenosum]